MRFGLSLLALLSFLPVHSMSPEMFNYKRTVQAADSITSEIAVFKIDQHIYRNTLSNFTDIRLFDNEQSEVAYMILVVTGADIVAEPFVVPLKPTRLIKPIESRMAILFDREIGMEIPTQLHIETPQLNFEKVVSVFGSNDGQQWDPLANDQLIYDYSKYFDMKNTDVSFKEYNGKYYKVVIDSITDFKKSAFMRVAETSVSGQVTKKYTEFIQRQESFRLDSIWFTGITNRVRNGKPIDGVSKLYIDSLQEVKSDRETWLYVSSTAEPIKTLSLKVESENFKRTVFVEGTNDTTGNINWHKLGYSDVFNIQIGSYLKEHLVVDLASSSRFIRYRLRIKNLDNKPIVITSITGKGERHEVVFFHRGKSKVNIYYGSANVSMPSYDISAVLDNTFIEKRMLWTLGNPLQQPSVSEPVKNSLLTPKRILVVSLGIMVLVLMWVLFVAVRKIDEKMEV